MAGKRAGAWARQRSAAAKIVAGAGVAIATIAGGLSLLFQVQPGFEPCLGGASARFTSAPVFPNVPYSHFLRVSRDESEKMIEATPNSTDTGAEVRFNYDTQSLRGAELPVYATLVEVSRSGAPTGVVDLYDEIPKFTVTPDHCSESGGYDVFFPITNARQRYRIVLEMYRGSRTADNRLALIETPVFQG